MSVWKVENHVITVSALLKANTKEDLAMLTALRLVCSDVAFFENRSFLCIVSCSVTSFAKVDILFS